MQVVACFHLANILVNHAQARFQLEKKHVVFKARKKVQALNGTQVEEFLQHRRVFGMPTSR